MAILATDSVGISQTITIMGYKKVTPIEEIYPLIHPSGLDLGEFEM